MKATSQSSERFAASKMFDGKHTGFGQMGGCAETKGTGTLQWFSIELWYMSLIESVMLLPRMDCCKEWYENGVKVGTIKSYINWTCFIFFQNTRLSRIFENISSNDENLVFENSWLPLFCEPLFS